ncbi:MAG: hypothetical protein CFE40_13090 [Burkholderiales bacterium PBB1]|nr:MAG: hypothetical protein CFE40_13090 [Burkholderiales bacterium PBB1]
MDKQHIPESFGVFKPVGHVVITLRTAGDLQRAEAALKEQGFDAREIVHYTPAEMIDQVNAEVERASPLAAIGQDLNLIKAHRELAQAGCSFLVVHAPEQAHVDKVNAVAHRQKAVAAQRYGRFVTEELIDGDTGNQTNESPDAGLDDALITARR